MVEVSLTPETWHLPQGGMDSVSDGTGALVLAAVLDCGKKAQVSKRFQHDYS